MEAYGDRMGHTLSPYALTGHRSEPSTADEKGTARQASSGVPVVTVGLPGAFGRAPGHLGAGRRGAPLSGGGVRAVFSTIASIV